MRKTNQLVLIGKFSDITNYLKECQSKYIYVQDLIDALSSTSKTPLC